MKKIYVGMSGGVDSSLTAALLKEKGYEVTGVYMKNWAKDLPGFDCPWRDDLADAKRVAVQLDIPFEIFDFQDEYFDRVVQYMLEGYKKGLTPNPDIMCNQEIKFKIFLDTALERGADGIATGHYARINDGSLLTGLDQGKDQTYFLYRVDEAALEKTLMPLGELQKSAVRDMARERGLITADKKDSMGICFVGKVGIKDFLAQFVDFEPGPIKDQKGEVVGEHEGAILYTIGQRHGLHVGGGLPFYVVNKDLDANTVYVTTDLDDERLWRDHLELTKVHWINQAPEKNTNYQVRTRHLAPLVECNIEEISGDTAILKLNKEIRAVTPGQSAVLYDGERVVGGGIII